jgi:hypothetical protein
MRGGRVVAELDEGSMSEDAIVRAALAAENGAGTETKA